MPKKWFGCTEAHEQENIGYWSHNDYAYIVYFYVSNNEFKTINASA